MAGTDFKYRVTLSVLDRLIDYDASAGVPSSRPQTLEDLKEALFRDLTVLLNTRRAEEPVPPGYPEASASLLTFGLPDFSSYSLRSPGDQERLRRAIETTIRLFEPRLSKVSVSLDRRESVQPVLRYRVNGMLRVEPAPEPIRFDTVLEGESGRFLLESDR